MGDIRRRLTNNAAYREHVKSAGGSDAVFFLTHRHYLARGLTSHQRATAALHHYTHERSSCDGDYFEAVYRQGGLPVWRREYEGTVFDIRLMPGNDVLHEGGLSLVLNVDGGRVCVVSFSIVPAAMFLGKHEANSEPHRSDIIFVTRKQVAADHSYQKVFNKAFDRTTPAHLCLGALTGIAMVKGHRRILGIAAAAHPSLSPILEERFEAAYSKFWESLAGQAAGPFGYLIDVPMQLKPLDQLDAKARKRAVARRAHIDAARDGAYFTMLGHALAPGNALPLPLRKPQTVGMSSRVEPLGSTPIAGYRHRNHKVAARNPETVV